jgi:serine/threonine-protein kinase
MERPSDPSSLETVAVRIASVSMTSSASSIAEEGRFVPGTLLVGRYRIIAMLGRGGMGEVYRATDLTLGQSVALKFLPADASRDQRLLERFHGEVRMARQVSHPNVCRVYDIGEVEGTPFLSMEYVDGEDLSSLLLRIGRLPSDKALETARKICAGLAAAHDRGIIHRDLKPANIMMNRRGEVVIMDFGLAALTDQLSGPEARNGTPAYMAPEQLRGSEVTARSDIYALGLVLYELFTGKRPYDGPTIQRLLEQQEAASLTSMTSIAADIDPGVEKVIRRCLDPDPSKRPATALQVAAALPGGDALAMALAAGETPSPEVVAAAGVTEGLARKYSIPCLIAIAVCLLSVPAYHQKTDALTHASLDYPPQVLRQKARDYAVSFGYSKRPADYAVWLNYRGDMTEYLKKLPQPRKWDEWLAAEAPIQLNYRDSLAMLQPAPFGDVTLHNPDPIEPGMTQATVDGAGHLLYFFGNPYAGAENPPAPVPPETAFHAAGLDMGKFSEITPTALPRSPTDQLRAWKGQHATIPKIEITVHVGWWKGRVTFVRVAFPWTQPESDDSRGSANLLSNILLGLLLIGLFFIILLARRNWKLGRSDRKGALRFAAVRFLLAGIVWAGTVHFIPDTSMVEFAFSAVGQWMLAAGLLWILYIALEPELRARWPHSIVTWNRLLAGRWNDAQVQAHILIGATVGVIIWAGAELVQTSFQERNTLEPKGDLDSVLGTGPWIATHASTLGGLLPVGLILFLSVFAMRLLVRKDLYAALLSAAVGVAFNNGGHVAEHWQIFIPVYFFLFASLMFVLLRLGLVALFASIFFLNTIGGRTVLGADLTTWYAPYGLATLALLLGIAIFAFWRSLGGRELLGERVES